VRVTERGEIPQLPAKAGIRWGKWIHSPSFQPKQAGGGDLHSFQPRQQEGAGRFHPASSQSRPGGGGLCLFASSEWQTQRECTANTPASSKDSRRATPAGGGGKLQSQPQLIWQCSRRFPANSCSECGSNTGRRFPATIPATAHLAM
jgi:hypothetical protein